jgi:hypothetical protein
MNLSVIIQPGQEREDVLEISNIYDMKQPGNYWIVATRKVGGLHSKGLTEAESNPVHQSEQIKAPILGRLISRPYLLIYV